MTALGPEPGEGIPDDEFDGGPGELSPQDADPGRPDLETSSEADREPESSEQRDVSGPKRRRLRLRQWLAVGAIVVGVVSAIVGPTLYANSDTDAESNITSWVRPAGLIVIVVGLAVLGLDFLFQTEQDRARKVANETPIIHIYGSGHRIALGDPFREVSGATASDTYMARQDQMLRDTYIQTISQARVIFWVSLVFMCLGGLILLVGALSAVYSGGNSGKVEAGIVTAVSGALTNLASATFLYQANRSRVSLADQAASMQARSIADRRITVVREIANDIGDEAERVNSLKELASALSRSINQLDARHATASTEPAAKTDDKRSESKSQKDGSQG